MGEQPYGEFLAPEGVFASGAPLRTEKQQFVDGQTALFQNVHKFLAGNGFMFIKIFCQFMKLTYVVLKDLKRLLMLGTYKLYHFFIEQCLRFKGAGKTAVSSQILIADTFHRNHVKILTHAIA